MKLKGILITGVIGMTMIVGACSQKTPTTAGEPGSGALVMPAKYNISNLNHHKASNKKHAKQMATKRSRTTATKQTAKRRTATKKRVAGHSQSVSSSSSPYITN